MFRRILAFILGLILGIILLPAGIAIGGYIVAVTVTPAKLSPSTAEVMGTLAYEPLWDVYKELKSLYTDNIGKLYENDLYFSLGDYLEKYEIGEVQSDGSRLAFGINLPSDVLQMPMFELFAGEQDGTSGFERASKQIKVSAIPSLLNVFSDGEGPVSAQLVEKLSCYSLADLLDETKGINYILQEVQMFMVLPNMFPQERTEDNAVMWAVGQTNIGKLLQGFGEGGMLLQLKDNLDLDGDGEAEFHGALSALGSLAFADLLGGTEGLVGNILGDKIIADLIDENGALAFNSLLDDIKLGKVLGYTLDEEGIWRDGNGNPATGIISKFVGLGFADLQDTTSLMNTLYQTKIGELIDGTPSGVMAAFADMTIDQLINGGFNNVELGDILFADSTTNVRIPFVLPNTADYVVTQLGTSRYYSYTRNDTTEYLYSVDGINYFVAESCKDETHVHDQTCVRSVWKQLDCTTEHEHTADCYKDIGDVMGKLADMTIADLQGSGISDKIMEMTLSDVLGESVPPMLGSLKDTPIGELSTALDTLYIGGMLSYTRPEATESDYTILITENVKSDGTRYVKFDGEKWYLAKLDCDDNTHTDSDHTADCYCYIWHDSANNEVGGINGALVNLTIGDLQGDGLTKAINKLKLSDVIQIDDSANPIMKQLADCPISDIASKINDIELGSVFGFTKNENDGKWYEKCTTPTCSHEDATPTVISGENYHLATGIQGALAGLTVNDLSNGSALTNAINGVKLGEIINIDSSNALLYSLKDSTIGSIGSDIQNKQLGIMLGLVLDENDNHWYEKCTSDCTHGDPHVIGGENYHLATGIQGALAGLTVNDLSNGSALTNAINGVKLGEIIEVGENNKMLSALADTPISELSKSINEMPLGTVLGYTHDDEHNCWMDENGQQVKGLNAKMAVLQINELGGDGGISSIIKGMTMGDLVDSKILTLDEESCYKLDILFDESGLCNFSEYMLNNAIPVTSQTAEAYYKDKHGNDETYRNAWKEQAVSLFITTLLSVL